MVCHGEGCNVAFSDVTFERCTLAATAGAKVTLTICTLNHRDRESVSVLASGTNTTVNMHDNTVQGGGHGVNVQAGASVNAKNLDIQHARLSGVNVSGELSTLEIKSCSTTLRDSSKAKLTSVVVRNASCGVVSTRSAAVSLSECAVEQCYCGVWVTEQGAANPVDCSPSDSAFGVRAQDLGTELEMRHCRVLRSKSSGVQISNGAKGLVHGCMVSRSGSNGVDVRGGGTQKQKWLTVFLRTMRTLVLPPLGKGSLWS